MGPDFRCHQIGGITIHIPAHGHALGNHQKGVCPFYDRGMVVQPYRADEHFAFVKTYEPQMTRADYNRLVYTPIHNVGGVLEERFRIGFQPRHAGNLPCSR